MEPWSLNPAEYAVTSKHMHIIVHGIHTSLLSCGPLSPLSSGSIGSYTSTEEGQTQPFNLTAVCQANGDWLPNPFAFKQVI